MFTNREQVRGMVAVLCKQAGMTLGEFEKSLKDGSANIKTAGSAASAAGLAGVGGRLAMTAPGMAGASLLLGTGLGGMAGGALEAPNAFKELTAGDFHNEERELARIKRMVERLKRDYAVELAEA